MRKQTNTLSPTSESEGFSKSEIFGLGLRRSPRTRTSEKLCLHWTHIISQAAVERETERYTKDPLQENWLTSFAIGIAINLQPQALQEAPFAWRVPVIPI
jgi:hypothetical protein